MSSIFVAPTEPHTIKTLGSSSSRPEMFGADLFWHAKPVGLVGVQRKELTDFVASMQDGRLSKEVVQMSRLDLAVVIVEGRGKWTRDGELLHNYSRVTRQQLRSFLWTIRSKGIWVDQTDNASDTVQTIEWLKRWTEKESHSSLHSRGGPGKSSWGVVSSRDYAIHLLSSFPSVGPKTAEAIIDHFGGVPMKWDVGFEELCEVPGVGKVTANKLMKALEREKEMAA